MRHVANSLRLVKGATLDELLNSGCWQSPNSFIKYYLQEFATDQLTGLHSVGPFMAAGTVVKSCPSSDFSDGEKQGNKKYGKQKFQKGKKDKLSK